MMIQQTSIDAHRANTGTFKNLGDRILALLSDGTIYTRREIAEDLGLATATVSGRVNELLQQGKLIEEPGRYKCEVSGNMVRGVALA